MDCVNQNKEMRIEKQRLVVGKIHLEEFKLSQDLHLWTLQVRALYFQAGEHGRQLDTLRNSRTQRRGYLIRWYIDAP